MPTVRFGRGFRLWLRVLVPLAGLVGTATPAGAYEYERAKAQFSNEAVDCTAYYEWLEANADRVNRGDQTVLIHQSRDYAFGLLMMLRSKPSDLQKIKDDVAQSRQKLTTLIDAEGPQPIMQQRDEPCQDLLDFPARRMKYWSDKSD